MDDFLKNIKDNLDNRPEPSFDENGWKGMQSRMAAKKNPNRGMIAWWWLPAAMLPLLLFNFWYWKTNSPVVQNRSIIQIERDTIYKTSVVYQTDTIYKTRVENQQVEVPIETVIARNPTESEIENWLMNALSNNLTEANSSNQASDINSTFLKHLFNILSEKFDGAIVTNENESSDSQEYDFNEIEKLNDLSPQFLALSDYIPESSIVNSDFVKKKSAEQKWFETKEMMRPKGLRLGVNGSIVLPPESDLKNSIGYSGGISAMIDFNDNFRMIGDFSYNQLAINTTMPNIAFGIPDAPTAPDDFIFEDAIADQQSIEFSVGFQYLFNKRKLFKPFIGATQSFAQ